MCLRHLVDTGHQGRHPHGGPFLDRELQGAVEGVGNQVLQAVLNVFGFPEEPLDVLDSLEIRHDDPSRIRQNVGNDEHTLVGQDAVGFEGGRTIGAFRKDTAA